MIVSHIVAASNNNVIGVKNDLPWDLPGDMDFFKAKTLHKTVVMGRKTFESIGRALPKRLNIVITRDKNFEAKDAFIAGSLEMAMALARMQNASETFIIGGGEIYAQSMPIVDRIYLTRVSLEVEGDTFYPPVDLNNFELIEQSKTNEYVIETYNRRRNVQEATSG